MGKTIAIDFDGVVHRYSKGYKDGSIYDKPVKGVRKAIARLKRKGFRVVVFTARTNRADVGVWLIKHGIDIDEITNIKPRAVAYIDDRAIRFTSWRDVGKYF